MYAKTWLRRVRVLFFFRFKMCFRVHYTLILGCSCIYLSGKGPSWSWSYGSWISGADPGFQVRRWGGAIKKNAPSGGRRENFWVFRVKNHDFTPKNHIFSNCGGRRENFWGISCEKSRFYAKKPYFYPGSAPVVYQYLLMGYIFKDLRK
jgi:hypothetical protein